MKMEKRRRSASWGHTSVASVSYIGRLKQVVLMETKGEQEEGTSSDLSCDNKRAFVSGETF